MHDRPDSSELIAAVRQHLQTALLPTLNDQGLRFQTLIAAHVLGIVEREIAFGASFEQAERDRLIALIERFGSDVTDLDTASLDALHQQLCDLIDRGVFDPLSARTALIDHLQQTATDKLQVNNPQFLARVANERMGES